MDARRSVEVSFASKTIAAVSTVVEWYDFTLYLYFATVLSRVFYGGGDRALLATLAGFGVSYGMRPLGAIVFGHLGDRVGRRHSLLLSMMLMTLAMLATACLPDRQTLGPAAGWLLVLLRCCMAFAVGGEYTGVVAYLLEGARPERRGLITSLAAAASEVGALLAVAVAAMTTGLLDTVRLEAWGWRIPFLLGALLAAVVWFARAHMQESPDFERQRRQRSIPATPLRHTLTRRRPALWRTFAISALGSISYYVGITYVPAFLASSGRMPEGRALGLSTFAALVVILVTPLAGLVSDRVGRRPVLLGLTLACVPLPLVLFHLLGSREDGLIVLGATGLACLAGGISAVAASATAEQFPGEGRLSGLALGVTVATAIFGGSTPFLAELLVRRTGWLAAPGAMIALVALAVWPAIRSMRESHPLLGEATRAET
ncbi:MAG: MFS transporter [Fulvimonas sp.]|nr:MFS transporter [Fulvimonas sp.]